MYLKPAVKRQKQELHKFEANWGHNAGLYQRSKTKAEGRGRRET